MIVRSLPYDISVLILKCISLKVLYVSIFPRFFISLIAFVFSKIQNKKPFVKCFRRKADYSLNPVSYTHLDVYKRQVLDCHHPKAEQRCGSR